MNLGAAKLEYPTRQIDTYTIDLPTGSKALGTTVALIGRTIRRGSIYFPLRHHAASLATEAPPKDYLAQLGKVFDDFVEKRWRYVKDPDGVENVVGDGKSSWGIVWGANAKPGQRGYGDCDDATASLGAATKSIGLPTRIATVNKPGSRSLFTHVYPEVKVPKVGWVAADPVGYPVHGIGWNPPNDRYAIWDLHGRLLKAKGRFPRPFRAMLKGMSSGDGYALGGLENSRDRSIDMVQYWKDYGLQNVGLAGPNDGSELQNWNEYGLLGFGAYSPQMGIIGDASNVMMEVDDDDDIDGLGIVRTKMMEMSPDEFKFAQRTGRPRIGSVALGDDGDVYQYVQDDQLGGFFKKLFKKGKKYLKKKARKAIRKLKKRARKLIKRLPGGKYLLKLHDRVHKIAMKIVRPLSKFVGKFAKKLAPIAALIPGYGPAIAAGLYTAGKIAKILNKSGILTDKKGKPKFKSGKQAKQFQRRLKKAAEAMKRAKRKGKSGRRRGSSSRRRISRGGRRVLRAGSRAHRVALRGWGADVEE